MALTFEEQQEMAKVAGEGIKAAFGGLGAKLDGYIDRYLKVLERRVAVDEAHLAIRQQLGSA